MLPEGCELLAQPSTFCQRAFLLLSYLAAVADSVSAFRWGYQPLDDAIKSNDPILFHLLAGNGAKLSDEFQHHAILDASREGAIQMINLLGESGADLNSCNYDQVH